MNRIALSIAAILVAEAVVLAQPAVPPVPVPGLAPAAPSQSVTVANKCCSIFDFLGVKQIGAFVDQTIMKSKLGQAVVTALSPIARAVGLGPSLLSDKFAKEGGAMGLAAQLKKEEKKAPLKIQAIKYLGTLDCQCYPEVVDALLDSLEDCNEKVRFEALQALANKCKDKKCLLGCLHKDKKGCTDACGTCDDCTSSNCPPCDCPGCMCQKKVIDRLNALLLARDEFGCLKEKSTRIRSLATEMIERCLIAHQPHPGVMEQPVQSDEVKPDPEPDVKPDPPAPDPAAKPTASRIEGIKNALPRWFGGNGNGQETVTEPAGHAEPAEAIDASAPNLVPHTVHYRAPAEGAPIPQAEAPTGTGERVLVAPPENTWNGRTKRRHLLGEVMGYGR